MKTQTMKLIKLTFLATVILLMLSNCRKLSHYTYTGQVISKGIDCGDTYIIKSNQKIKNVENIDYTYYADQLPDDYKINGLEIKFNCRVPSESETYICTCLGIAYPHIIITEIDME